MDFASRPCSTNAHGDDVDAVNGFFDILHSMAADLESISNSRRCSATSLLSRSRTD